MSTLVVREYESINIGEPFAATGKTLSRDQAYSLLNLSASLKAGGMRGDAFVLDGRSKLKAQHFVGVVQFGTYQIEIIPKIDGLDHNGARTNLFHMLCRTSRLKIHESEISRLKLQNMTVLEMFISMFCDRLFVEVHRGLVSNYERISDNQTALRGKLLTGLQATLNAFHPERFQCEYDEYTIDTPLNRVLKAAVRKLRRISRDTRNVRRLAELDFTLDAVNDVSVSSLEWHRLHFDRANRRYQSLVAMARLFLRGLTQDLSSGDSDGLGFLIDMNELFEEYIGECIRSVITDRRDSVVLQGPVRSLLQDKASGAEAFRTKPDICCLRDKVPHWIVDTKWKRLDDEKSELGVSQSDVYQMIGYSGIYGVNDVLLLYPYHAKLDGKQGLERTYRIRDQENSCKTERYIHVATVSLADLNKINAQLTALINEITSSGKESTSQDIESQDLSRTSRIQIRTTTEG